MQHKTCNFIATKFISKTKDEYETRLTKLNLLSLDQRRALADVSFFWKALNGMIDIDVQPYVEYYSKSYHYSLRHSDNLTLKKKYARTRTLKFSFFHRILDKRNELPLDTRCESNRRPFKAKARNFLKS